MGSLRLPGREVRELLQANARTAARYVAMGRGAETIRGRIWRSAGADVEVAITDSGSSTSRLNYTVLYSVWHGLQDFFLEEWGMFVVSHYHVEAEMMVHLPDGPRKLAVVVGFGWIDQWVPPAT